MKIILTAFTLSLILSLGISPVFAAQFSTFITPLESDAPFTITYQRTIYLTYENGGEWKDQLEGVTWSEKITAEYDDVDVRYLGKKISDKMRDDGSNAEISDLTFYYTVNAIGRSTAMAIDYKIKLEGTVSNHELRQQTDDIAGLIDVAWRGISLSIPITVNDKEINMPKSPIKENLPEIYNSITDSNALDLLSVPLINADRVNELKLTNWHKLFDSTGISEDAKRSGLDESILGKVFTKFTMGESSFREGRVVEKKFIVDFTQDQDYQIRSIESADIAEITILGFGVPTFIEGIETIGVNKNAPKDTADTSTGNFPVAIIYGMAAMAGVGALGILLISSRKLKHEGKQQTGIDPKDLQSFQTSSSAGGYQTNRGEAQLKSESQYQQHKNVYEDKPKTTNRGTMPKGWN